MHFRILPSLHTKLVLTKKMIEVYSEPRFCRNMDGVLPIIHRKQVLESRICTLNQHVPTFMAAYGVQHDLPERLLVGQGLHTCLIKSQDEKGEVRFFAPHEIALMLGIHDRFKLSHDIRSNFLAVGNAISTFHAGIVLARMMELFLEGTPTAEMIVKRMLETRLTTDSSLIGSFHDATMIYKHDDDSRTSLPQVVGGETQVFTPELNICLCTNNGLISVTCEGHANLEQVCESYLISTQGKRFFLVDDTIQRIDATYQISSDGVTIHAVDENIPTDMIRIREQLRKLVHDTESKRAELPHCDLVKIVFTFLGKPFYEALLPGDTPVDSFLRFTEFGHHYGILNFGIPCFV